MTLNNKTKTSISIISIVTVIVVLSTSLSLSTVAAQSETTNPAMLAKLEQAKERVLQLTNEEYQQMPVFVSWVDEKTNTLVVGIKNDASVWSFFYDLFYPQPKKEIYEQRLKLLVGDLPMKVEFGRFIQEACSSRTVTCRPLIGGITIYDGTNGQSGTLMMAATKGATSGIIISGHVVGCTTGHIIDQTAGSGVGTVSINPSSTRTSDSAFVPLNAGITSSQKIYKASNSDYNIIGKKASSLTAVGTTVKMSGLISGVTTGTIQAKGVGFQHAHCGTYDLNSQILANYVSTTGDSGAPIFSVPDASDNVYIYGIHSGTMDFGGYSYKVYSPWESIASELGVS